MSPLLKNKLIKCLKPNKNKPLSIKKKKKKKSKDYDGSSSFYIFTILRRVLDKRIQWIVDIKVDKS